MTINHGKEKGMSDGNTEFVQVMAVKLRGSVNFDEVHYSFSTTLEQPDFQRKSANKKSLNRKISMHTRLYGKQIDDFEDCRSARGALAKRR